MNENAAMPSIDHTILVYYPKLTIDIFDLTKANTLIRLKDQKNASEDLK